MNKKSLVIDDNADVVEVVSLALTDLFDKVDSANTIDSAVKFLEENTYTLIFLDVHVGNRNGAEIVKFLSESADNSNKNVPFVIISGIITPQFIERHQKRFAGMLMKPFKPSDITTIAEEVLLKVNAISKPPALEEAPVDEIPYLKCDLPFPIIQLEEKVNKILDQVKKTARLKTIFSQMKIDRSSDNYILSHIGILINISTAICMQMEWNTDKTLEKFVYAAYLHDMALSSRPDLARINTAESLELKKDKLTPGEYKLVFEHPNIAASTIDDMDEVPADVSMIIKQHHELPKETGFPTKCGHLKISPLSSVFIVAHDMTEHILSNPKWTVADYLIKAKAKFHGPHFSKILRSLADSKG